MKTIQDLIPRDVFAWWQDKNAERSEVLIHPIEFLGQEAVLHIVLAKAAIVPEGGLLGWTERHVRISIGGNEVKVSEL